MSVRVPVVDPTYQNVYSGKHYAMATFLYDLAIFFFNIAFTIFFRKIHVRGTSNLPPQGRPAIVVCAPHANQFVDPTLVMTQVKKLPGQHSRRPCFVMAAASFKKPLVGMLGRWTAGISVDRAADHLRVCEENMVLYCPDYDKDPLRYKVRPRDGARAIRDVRAVFTENGLLGLPGNLGSAQIAALEAPDAIRVQRPFGHSSAVRTLLERGTDFLYAPKLDNGTLFQDVFNHLHTKGLVGIFPEGGSHDRPSLLPIKAGVAIMALRAVAADPEMEISIVPCGLYYFHRHMFRSRAVLEFGAPIIVDGAMGQKYLQDPKTTVSELLDQVVNALYSVTVNTDDYDILMLVQATRRLYQAAWGNKRVPLAAVVEMNRKLSIGYTKHKEHPRIKHLMLAIRDYDAQLYSLGLKDHQVDELRNPNEKAVYIIFLFLTRLFHVLVFALLSLPGALLFSPIFITCHFYSQKKAREGLKRSLVKIKGDDLLATWKLVVAFCMTPALYAVYAALLTYLTFSHFHPLIFANKIGTFMCYYVLLLATTYASFVIGEIGMDVFKSLPPLFISLIYPSQKLQELREIRKNLSAEVYAMGPAFFPDLDRSDKSERDSAVNSAPAQLMEPALGPESPLLQRCATTTQLAFRNTVSASGIIEAQANDVPGKGRVVTEDSCWSSSSYYGHEAASSFKTPAQDDRK
ncbi:AGR301Cp [Eremothecium gossypii ATCC 10895]|uniref:AGR301Cp n=1 Tax=Eremothecium gossypii (strain ATCC 10895 / CBS 109.51 / FGSC 9923 / NRRL Y-1056) TaxID=284811 RepID=Q74ZA2_EREGS|nr:AGR301Cp [Eremothecium gossypii ATCC 10895]AAS54791.2 AGR301Cp [Eremothecium gossypii ATCC 10895]